MENKINTEEVLKLPKRNILNTIFYFIFWLLAVAVLMWAWKGAEIRPIELIKNAGNIWTLCKDFFPPDFHDWLFYINQIIITIQIAIWGTVLAVIFSVPFGLLSAKNIAPVWIRQPVRRLMDVFRSVNELIFAILFVSAVGLGPFAGVLALFVHTLGTLAKLFSEAVEAIDPHPVEGIKATGANVISEIIYGVIPQVMPLWISYSLYRFESNVRSATVVGMVGAGGVGFILYDAVRSFQYTNALAMLILIVIAVSFLDMLSAKIRQQFT